MYKSIELRREYIYLLYAGRHKEECAHIVDVEGILYVWHFRGILIG